MTKAKKAVLVSAGLGAASVEVMGARTFTVVNACTFTIWPAIYTDLNVGDAPPDFPTGWEAKPLSHVVFQVPDNWASGRIWGRRDCDFTVKSGPTCLTGSCNGGLLCDQHTGTGVPPASVAEWTLQGGGNHDFYDVSIVDGFNLPMRITNRVGCPVADCAVDLNPSCPKPLMGPLDSTGSPSGCKSACSADPNPQESPNCCSGSYANNCPSSGVQFYDFFKSNCPNSYAYAFDESSGTALWNCDSSLQADYTLTFCPTPNGTSPAVTSSSVASAPPTRLAVPVTVSNTQTTSTSSSAPAPSLRETEAANTAQPRIASIPHIVALTAVVTVLRLVL